MPFRLWQPKAHRPEGLEPRTNGPKPLRRWRPKANRSVGLISERGVVFYRSWLFSADLAQPVAHMTYGTGAKEGCEKLSGQDR